MQLTLLVPGLLLPDTVRNDTVFDLEAPALSLILGRGQRHAGDTDWLCEAFGTAPPLPAAALRRLGASAATRAASPPESAGLEVGGPIVGAGGTASDAWLCLDPVHWQVAREGIHLADPADLRLEDDEAAALIAAVQPLFTPWGEITASQACHWELRLARSLLLETRPLPACIGSPVDPALPGGLDGAEWRRLLTEVQTVLHAHPVNRQREALGRPVVNSLWPWGFGSLPDKPRTDFTVGWSDDPVTAGLCAHTGIPCLRPPARFQCATGNVLCQLDWLAHAAYTLNALGWRLALLKLEQEWVAPALAAMKRGECQALRLVGTGILGDARAVVFSLVRGNLWRFWQRPLPLSELA